MIVRSRGPSGNAAMDTYNDAYWATGDRASALDLLHAEAEQDERNRPARRGTSNGNASGSAEDRRRRRVWLVETFRANVDAFTYPEDTDGLLIPISDPVSYGLGTPACRCYRCGDLLTVDTVTVDRIIPGCRGGTYRRNNIRPACGPCNSKTGGAQRSRKARS